MAYYIYIKFYGKVLNNGKRKNKVQNFKKDLKDD